VITRVNTIKVDLVNDEFALRIGEENAFFKDAVFFDLEHYVYKKPICVGVFGCCYYDEEESALKVTQYMIENKDEVKDILIKAKEYFEVMAEKFEKKYIVTFSGNNDFTVIHYLFNKYKVDYCIQDHFIGIDLQRHYEKRLKENIGLKALEKKFEILRDSEVISGSNLAKTFSKIMKDKEYISRMPEGKIEKILLYNEQDVVSLFHIYRNWEQIVQKEERLRQEETALQD
jgi:uncharacterized protein YprB with RNaseH-like and TPR domain